MSRGFRYRFDVPPGRAVAESLQRRDREPVERAQLGEHLWVADPRRPPVRGAGAAQPAGDPVHLGDPVGPPRIVRGQAAHRPRTLARGGRLLHRPGHVGQAAPPHRGGATRRARDVEPQRRRLERTAVVRRRPAADDHAQPAAGQRDVQQVPLEVAGLGRLQTLTERIAEPIGEERVVAAGRDAALLQAEHDHHVGVERPRRAQVADQDAGGRVLAHVDAGGADQPAQLILRRPGRHIRHVVQDPQHRPRRGQLEPVARRDAARLEAVRGDHHPAHGLGDRDPGIARRAQPVDGPDTAAEQLGDALLHRRRLVHGPAAEPSLDEVDPAPRQARPGRAQEREQVAPRRVVVPRERQQPLEREPERRPADRGRPLHHVRDPGPRERLRQLGPVHGIARRDDCDPLGGCAGAQRGRHLGHHQVGLGAGAAHLEEPHARVTRLGGGRLTRLEQAPLELLEARWPETGERRQLRDRGALGEPSGAAAERGEGGPARLVRQRHDGAGAVGDEPHQRLLRVA